MVDELLDVLDGAQFFLNLYCSTRYHQIEMVEEEVYKTMVNLSLRRCLLDYPTLLLLKI